MMIDAEDAKAQLSMLIDRAAAGEEIVLAKAGRPLARLIPYRAAKLPRQPGVWQGRVRMADDFDTTPAETLDTFSR